MPHDSLILSNRHFDTDFFGGGGFMSTNVIYVRFGLGTCCYCCGKPFTPEHPDIVLCPDCLPDQQLLEDALKLIEAAQVRNAWDSKPEI